MRGTSRLRFGSMKRMSIITILAAVAVLTLNVGQSHAEEEVLPTGTVRGTVAYQHGPPLSDVKVTLLNGKGNVIRSTRTNRNGNYRFEEGPA